MAVVVIDDRNVFGVVVGAVVGAVCVVAGATFGVAADAVDDVVGVKEQRTVSG
jgi:hypothetical protein